MTSLCAYCQSPASGKCDGCRGCPASSFDREVNIVYCGKSCENAHFRAHKKECEGARLREGLRMICTSVSNVIREYRKLTYEFPLKAVETEDNGRKMEIQPYGTVAPKHPGGRSHVLLDPDWSSFPIAIQELILLTDACEEVTILAIKPLLSMLKGIAKQLGALRVKHRGPPDIQHSVMLCILENDERFVLDFSAAQFGNFDVICPVELYISKYCVGDLLDVQTLRDFRMMYYNHLDGESGDERAVQVYARMMLDTIDRCVEPFYHRYCLVTSTLIQYNDTSKLATWLRDWETWYIGETAEVVAALDGQWESIRTCIPNAQELEEMIETHMDWTAHKRRIVDVLDNLPGVREQRIILGL